MPIKVHNFFQLERAPTLGSIETSDFQVINNNLYVNKVFIKAD